MDTDILAERDHLMALAYRMLGTVTEAEDAVQETFVRWYRLSEAERGAVTSLRGWSTRVAARICLDLLASARARRERYVGPWLPEPVPLGTWADPAAAPTGSWADPAARAELDDSVSTALLVVLEAMTPAERAVFVLHEVFAVPFAEVASIVGRSADACRQLASSARRRVAAGRARRVPRAEHDRVVRAFAAAAASGDVGRLARVLDPAVVVYSDGGGRVTAARRPVRGVEHVSRLLLGLMRTWPQVVPHEQQTADGLAYVLRERGRVFGVLHLDVAGGRVTELRMVLNPDKLTLWE